MREFGSGNIGATNARRAAGTGWGVVALFGDVLKGALPVLAAVFFISRYPETSPAWLPETVALGAIFGHIFPAYFKLKPSGKGVATTIGAFLVLSPMAVGIMLAGLIIAVLISRRMSVGSLVGMVCLPLSIWIFYDDPVLFGCSVVAAVLTILRHKDNIRRLRQGREPSLGGR